MWNTAPVRICDDVPGWPWLSNHSTNGESDRTNAPQKLCHPRLNGRNGPFTNKSCVMNVQKHAKPFHAITETARTIPASVNTSMSPSPE